MEENERRFEQDIEKYLLSLDGGYIKGNPQDFDRECALNKKDLFLPVLIFLSFVLFFIKKNLWTIILLI